MALADVVAEMEQEKNELSRKQILTMNVTTLRSELTERGLDSAGQKADLVLRLWDVVETNGGGDADTEPEKEAKKISLDEAMESDAWSHQRYGSDE